MASKIKVSYQEPEELQEVIRLLKPRIRSCSIAKEQKGKFKRAYIMLKELVKR